MKEGEPYSPNRRFRCAFVPLSLMGNTDLSAGAKLTFGRLALYAGTKTTCFPSLGRLATDLGVSIDVIGRWLKELITAKLIRRTRVVRAEMLSANLSGTLALERVMIPQICGIKTPQNHGI